MDLCGLAPPRSESAKFMDPYLVPEQNRPETIYKYQHVYKCSVAIHLKACTKTMLASIAFCLSLKGDAVQ